jgi:hypothetical protein
MLETGRMNMCGVTPANVHRIARAMRDVIGTFPLLLPIVTVRA